MESSIALRDGNEEVFAASWSFSLPAGIVAMAKGNAYEREAGTFDTGVLVVVATRTRSFQFQPSNPRMAFTIRVRGGNGGFFLPRDQS